MTITNKEIYHSGRFNANLVISFLQGNIRVFEDIDKDSIPSLSNFILHHGLTTHLYKILTTNSLNDSLTTKLKSHYFAVSIRNTQLFETYRVLAEKFDLHAIEYIPLKGIFLLPFIYNDTAGRNISDIDILIHPSDYPTVQTTLLELGATQIDENESLLLQEMGHHYTPFTLFNCSIEIHSRLFAKNMRYHIDIEQIWQQKEIYKDKNGKTNGVNEHQLLAYLALHIHYSEMRGEYRLYWYLDIYKVLLRAGCILSAQFLAHIEQQRIKKPVLKVISRVAYLFGLEVEGVNSLSIKEIAAFEINLGGDEKRTNRGYSIMLERLFYTKGVLNRYYFLRDTILHNKQHHEDTSLLKRFFRLVKNTLRYLFNVSST